MNVVGQRLAGLIARVKGPRYVSPLMVKLNFGSYCRKIENAQSPNAWLSRDKSVVKAYDADGLCTLGLPLRPTARCSRRSTTSAQRHGHRLLTRICPCC
ncbi:lysophospholipase [Gemmiger formicilis]|nr:lysophospholipase [Gemmiger formicilis]